MISFECKCKARINVDEQLGGRIILCPRCHRKIRVPGVPFSSEPIVIDEWNLRCAQRQEHNTTLGNTDVERNALEDMAAASSASDPAQYSLDTTSPSDDPLGQLVLQTKRQPGRSRRQRSRHIRSMDYIIVCVCVLVFGLAVGVVVMQLNPFMHKTPATERSDSDNAPNRKLAMPQQLRNSLKGPSFFEGKEANRLPSIVPEDANTNGQAPSPTPEIAPAPAPVPPPVPKPTPRRVVRLANCTYCRKLRTIQCTTCMTTGGISTGLMPCPKCKLRRTIVCPDCNGHWADECSSCNGSGGRYERVRRNGLYFRVRTGDCARCCGTGIILRCRKCKKGRIRCPYCDGVGRIGTCTTCLGKKRVPCPKCTIVK